MYLWKPVFFELFIKVFRIRCCNCKTTKAITVLNNKHMLRAEFQIWTNKPKTKTHSLVVKNKVQ